MRAAVRHNLGEAWLTAEALAPFTDGGQVAPVPAFEDSEYTQKLGPEGADKRFRFTTNRAGVEFLIWKVLPAPTEDSTLFLTTESLPVFALQTDSERRDDGVIQLFGAAMGILLFTPQELYSQRGKKLCDGPSLRMLSFETRNESGDWRSEQSFQIPVEATGGASISFET